MKKSLALLAALLTLFAAWVAPAAAQGYPARPVKIIVPFPPGQAADIFTRMVAERLTQKWGHQVVVENRAGGGGVPGMIAGKQAAPDGYTLMVGTSGTLGVNPNVYAKIPYDPLKDFIPASNIFIVPLVLVGHPGTAPASVKVLVDEEHRNPGRISYASAGTGTAQHMTGELFRHAAKIGMVHIPYKGSGPAMTDLLAGQVPLMVDSLSAALPHIKAGKARALAVTTATRVPHLPDVPTLVELGFPSVIGAGWSGILLPAGTAREIVDKVSADIQSVLNEPAMRERIIERGAIADPNTPQQFADFIRAEIVKWGEVARVANVKLD